MTEHQVSDHVAGKIRDARKQRGWTTDELAERCGLTGNIIENIEGGRRRGGGRTRDVTLDELFAISEAFGVGPLKLLPSRPRPYGPEDQERERALEQAMQDLGAERSRLQTLETEMRRVQDEWRVVEDRIAKTEWLIEQLRERG
jgi:transcriptional regulator with XRE-family HTH domain